MCSPTSRSPVVQAVACLPGPSSITDEIEATCYIYYIFGEDTKGYTLKILEASHSAAGSKIEAD